MAEFERLAVTQEVEVLDSDRSAVVTPISRELKGWAERPDVDRAHLKIDLTIGNLNDADHRLTQESQLPQIAFSLAQHSRRVSIAGLEQQLRPDNVVLSADMQAIDEAHQIGALSRNTLVIDRLRIDPDFPDQEAFRLQR